MLEFRSGQHPGESVYAPKPPYHYSLGISMHRSVLLLSLTTLLGSVSWSHADWLRFRGPNGSGISAESVATPEKWGPEDVKWKTALPGPGSSCPIIVGDRVFVTCWSGYGLDRQAPGKQAELRRHLLCIDRLSGEEIWSKVVEPYLPEDEYGGMFAEHGYASHTPVSDGSNVYVFFGKTGVLAFDLNGQRLWQQNVGTESGARDWGSSSSPILYKDFVIVPATAESESLVALDKASGKEVWRAEAAGFNSTWGSPILVPVDDQRQDLVMAIPGEMWGLNPDTGKLAWYAEGVPVRSMCSSAIADQNGVVYAVDTGPGEGGVVAVRAGGSKDVTKSHVVWSGRQASRIATPLAHDGRLYLFSRGTMTCLDATNGDELYRGRLRSAMTANDPEPPARSGRGGEGRGRGGFGEGRGGFGGGRGGRGGQDYGSPILADGKIYFTSRRGETFVLKAGDTLEQLAANRVSADVEDFSATPAISDGELYLRSDKHLYCVAKGN